MVTMCLIHILIAGIKLNSHKFWHANELEAELIFLCLLNCLMFVMRNRALWIHTIPQGVTLTLT